MGVDRRVAGSFRDPSGFLFWKDGRLYRQVNTLYRRHYDRLMESGLYQNLVKDGLLVSHSEVDPDHAIEEDAYRVLLPDAVPFISYPYEWCFSQLKDAALVTLEIQKRALEFDMTLKDASAYNMQFVGGRPMLIDTLSFEVYQEGTIWVAYRQFCQHFLAPLSLIGHRDVRLSQLLRVYIDGVPLDLAASLLPWGTRLRPGLLAHIHAHARAQRAYADKTPDASRAGRMTRQRLLGLIQSLESTVKQLKWQPDETEWADYYEGDSYEERSFRHKRDLVETYIQEIAPASLWDLGANTGLFSRIASAQDVYTVAWDVDPGAVELNYRQTVREGEDNILPLMQNLTNPSPALGWANAEREGLTQRGPVDTVLALALIHHLAIANNVPLGEVAGFFARLCKWLVIEFVPRDDPKVEKLFSTREDIFSDYSQMGFEAAFSRFFAIERSDRLDDSDRILYLMRSK